MHLLALGMVIYPISRGTSLLVDMFLSPSTPLTPDTFGAAVLSEDAATRFWAFAMDGLGVAALIPALGVALWLSLWNGDGSRVAPVRRGVVLLFVLTVLFSATRPFGIVPAPFSIAVVILVWPAIVVYGVLREHMFGIDVRARWTVRQSTVAAAFLAIFFVVSEAAAEILSDRWGPVLGLAAAGVLVLGLAPLQRFAERVSTAAIPYAGPEGAMGLGERGRAYLGMAEVAWRDGNLTSDERDMLDEARERLGLTHRQAAHLEERARERE